MLLDRCFDKAFFRLNLQGISQPLRTSSCGRKRRGEDVSGSETLGREEAQKPGVTFEIDKSFEEGSQRNDGKGEKDMRGNRKLFIDHQGIKKLKEAVEGFDVEQKREIKEKLKDHNNIHPETSTIHQNDPPIDCLYILHLRG